MTASVRVAVSACLLGESVRYNGAHKLAASVVELARVATLVPVCPELEIGLGVPREPIQLVQRGEAVRLLGVTSRADHTEAMAAFATRRAQELAPLDGFVFKKKSPSCGLDVPLHDLVGNVVARSRGRFADALVRAFPDLPVVEEEEVDDHFIESAKAHARLRRFLEEGWTASRAKVFLFQEAGLVGHALAELERAGPETFSHLFLRALAARPRSG
jgi:uncharacterized protein YbbK (DUF523 family)